jgi:hypothetical protein
MKKMKRFFAGLLAVVMLTMATPVYAAPLYKDEDAVIDLSQEEIIDLLMGLDIIEGYEDGEFHGERNVTRAEMATIIIKTLKLDAAPATEIFDDVALTHWANGYITRAYAEGIVKGDGNGSFRPDATVTYAEVYTMFINVLNYQPNKDLAWPANYVTVARANGIADGIMAYDSVAATRNDVATIVWNALNTEVMMPYTIGDIVTYVSSEKTLLDNRFDEVEYLEEVKFNGFELANKKDKEFKVEVTLGKKDYTYAANDFYTFVEGVKVNALVVNKEIVSLELAEDFEIIDGLAAELKEEDKDIKGTKGYGYIAYNEEEIVAEKFFTTNLVVNEIKAASKVKNTISFIKGADMTVVFNAKKTNYNLYEKMFIYENERLTAMDLEAGDILTQVAKNIYLVSKETVEGTVEGFDTDKVNTFITIDNDNYVFTSNTTYVKYDDEAEVYETIKRTATKDEEVVAYINIFGEVVTVALPADVEPEETYGIVTDINKTVKKVFIDDVKYDYDDLNGAAEGDIIIFELNEDNEVVVVNTYTLEDVAAATTVVTKVNGNKNIELNDGSMVIANDIEDFLQANNCEVYFVNVDDEATEFYSVVEKDVEEIKPSFFKKNDRIEIEYAEDVTYVVIVRGL